ncbi:hypothetical protein JQ593_22610 [Bradyrhizobium viridifuturi]|jgi:hypothetical protein|uniref:hypothetical protein n=1 Tax=Bacteria TaxID=2 RepID=UPI0004BD9695|nr:MULTISPECIES: hypothetical protein [Bacteria]MBR1038879.1 hypothetical protein [Bradyrhizobium viridifuturi]MCA3704208.1 hypothetical protein [Methylobacterium sp.]OYU58616.1 MAG: hypothetical protein CFE30_30090 [Bradyrhizobium sp. PARBB1]MBR1075888.1 hypothetical protein [Bradyrhizobium viridifuturi]MCA3794640.1 hypothetical protein [Burkholderia sp.]
MAKIKFKNDRGIPDLRTLKFKDGGGDTLIASVDPAVNAREHYWLTFSVNDGDVIGMDRDEAVDFAIAIMREATHRE